MIAALGWGLLAMAASGQAPPTFSSQVEVVHIDAFVTQGGQPVAGLTASDFELKDNGVRQRLELVAAESRPLLAVLVFDTSSSMEGDRLTALRAAGGAFLDGLRPADQAALVTFSHEVTWLAGPTTDKEAVRSALARLRAEGLTSVFDALYSGIALSDSGSRPLVVLFTDGEDNSSILSERQLRTQAERSNALVHVVGWPVSATAPSGRLSPAQPAPRSTHALQEIAEVTGGRVWAADSPGQLRQAFAAIAEALSHRYVLRYEPEGVKREGWHRIDLRLRGPKGDVRARRGYWVAAANASPEH